jgi:AraC family transcriptional regulator of adaptative response/methylated-DNA-[protein]-cysteine methyltransferase
MTQDTMNYDRIAEAIQYIQANYKAQPTLEELAEKVHLSPHHFQRMFTEWAGTSPKKFLQYISIGHAKKMLVENRSSLFDTALNVGLSGTSRLHDLFVNIEGMTPGEYKNGGASLTISYSFAWSPFGKLMVASTLKGICDIAFSEDETVAFDTLRQKFPNATYQQSTDGFQHDVLQIFTDDWSKLSAIKLHLKGTDFQIKVWEALLKIPMGGLTTYGDIARHIEKPNACRAVGSAVGDNPVAFLIPCHRIIQSTGVLGHYHWGSARKTAMIGWEAARADNRSALSATGSSLIADAI